MHQQSNSTWDTPPAKTSAAAHRQRTDMETPTSPRTLPPPQPCSHHHNNEGANTHRTNNTNDNLRSDPIKLRYLQTLNTLLARQTHTQLTPKSFHTTHILSQTPRYPIQNTSHKENTQHNKKENILDINRSRFALHPIAPQAVIHHQIIPELGTTHQTPHNRPSTQLHPQPSITTTHTNTHTKQNIHYNAQNTPDYTSTHHPTHHRACQRNISLPAQPAETPQQIHPATPQKTTFRRQQHTHNTNLPSPQQFCRPKHTHPAHTYHSPQPAASQQTKITCGQQEILTTNTTQQNTPANPH